MAKSVSLALLSTLKDTSNVAVNSGAFGSAQLTLDDKAITDGDSKNLTIASGVTARNIFPSGLAAATVIEFFGVVNYDSAEPTATAEVEITIDGAAAATTFGRVISFRADTSATLTTNAASSATIQLTWWVAT